MDIVINMSRSILLAAVGGLYTYHANVFNIAMEGMMLIGAFLGILRLIPHRLLGRGISSRRRRRPNRRRPLRPVHPGHEHR